MKETTRVRETKNRKKKTADMTEKEHSSENDPHDMTEESEEDNDDDDDSLRSFRKSEYVHITIFTVTKIIT